MRYSAEHKQQTRAKVINAAGQVFREEGYGGAGIDALSKAAGVTNGAFYGHFESKRQAFRTAVSVGLEELRDGIAALKIQQPEDWFDSFVSFYLGYKRTCALGESCALPSLSADVMRADDETRDVYTKELVSIVEEIASGLPGTVFSDKPGISKEDRALMLLALLTGGAMLARTVSDPELSERIAGIVKGEALSTLSDPGNT